jgi:hypothetical protein
MSAHLSFDVAASILLTMSPWLFGFVDIISWPHAVFGLIAIVATTPTLTPREPHRLRA